MQKQKTNSVEDEVDVMEAGITCYYSEQTLKTYRFFLDEDIVQPSKYRDLIQCLMTATEYDTVELFINSSGGQLDSAEAIVSAITSSDANVIGVINGKCYSAAGIIALACHELYVEDSAEFMVHSASYGRAGSHTNIFDYASFSERKLNALYDKVYFGFLTEQEIADIKQGREIWLLKDEIVERLEQRNIEHALLEEELAIDGVGNA